MRKAILALIDFKNDKTSMDTKISECISLAEADDIEIVAEISQKSFSADPVYGFRSGKLDELRELIMETEVDLIVFANNLKMNQITNLANLFGIDILDRTNLILDIFRNNAVTKEARLQTEVAYLKYNLQRYLNLDLDIDRITGGAAYSKGKGESKLNLQKRKVYKRIHQLNAELKKLQKKSVVSRKQQNDTRMKKVALVGYTNAGKSSLMNRLLIDDEKEERQVLQKDMLFATLDSVCRNVKLKEHNILLYDTIGFVSDLPHDLIEAFRSTLDVAKEADLLIEVIDVSNPNYLEQKEIVDTTLAQIGCSDIKRLVVYNKADLLEVEFYEGLCISCVDGTNIDLLKDEIEEKLFENERKRKVKLSYDKVHRLYRYQDILKIRKLEEDAEGVLFEITGPDSIVRMF